MAHSEEVHIMHHLHTFSFIHLFLSPYYVYPRLMGGDNFTLMRSGGWCLLALALHDVLVSHVAWYGKQSDPSFPASPFISGSCLLQSGLVANLKVWWVFSPNLYIRAGQPASPTWMACRVFFPTRSPPHQSSSAPMKHEPSGRSQANCFSLADDQWKMILAEVSWKSVFLACVDLVASNQGVRRAISPLFSSAAHAVFLSHHFSTPRVAILKR